MNKDKPKMRFDDAELSLIKNTFADNEELLKIIRRVLLQLPLTLADVEIVNSVLKGKDEIKSLILKFFNPTINGYEHLHQVLDLWMTIDYKEKGTDYVLTQIKARKLLIDYVNQQIEKLFDLSKEETIKFKELTNFDNIVDSFEDDYLVNLLARNTIISHVEQQLTQITILAGQKTESVDDTIKRLQKDSAK